MLKLAKICFPTWSFHLVLILSLHIGDVTSVAALVLMSLLTTLFIDGSPLLDAGVVAFEFDASVGGKVENMLHCLSVQAKQEHECG